MKFYYLHVKENPRYTEIVSEIKQENLKLRIFSAQALDKRKNICYYIVILFAK